MATVVAESEQEEGFVRELCRSYGEIGISFVRGYVSDMPMKPDGHRAQVRWLR